MRRLSRSPHHFTRSHRTNPSPSILRYRQSHYMRCVPEDLRRATNSQGDGGREAETFRRLRRPGRSPRFERIMEDRCNQLVNAVLANAGSANPDSILALRGVPLLSRWLSQLSSHLLAKHSWDYDSLWSFRTLVEEIQLTWHGATDSKPLPRIHMLRHVLEFRSSASG
jgi:hypothetical protein